MRTPLWTKSVAGLVLSLLLLGLLVLYQDPWLSQRWSAPHLMLNLLPVYLLFGLLFGLSRRISIAFLLSAVAASVTFYINSRKLSELGQPLLFSDFYLLPQVIGSMGLFVRYSHGAILFGAAIAVLGVAVLCFRRERPRIEYLAAVAFSGLAAILMIGLTTEPAKRLYAHYGAFDASWNPIWTAEHNGLIAALTAAAASEIVIRPARNPDAMNSLRVKLAGSHPGSAGNHGAHPDIVLILSESFFDPGRLNHVDRCEALPNWCGLVQGSVHSEIQVPTVGGNTTRTEFEVLTGVPVSMLPPQVYPYTSVVVRRTASASWWLKALGYETIAVHPHLPYFWRRHHALPLLGFDEFLSRDEFDNGRRTGLWISDEALTDRIIEELQQRNSRPNFIFAISMENHGPWQAKRGNLNEEALTEIPFPGSMPEDDQLAYRQYIFHARNAVEQLARLKTQILLIDKPIIVVFFGDHLPALPRVFHRLGFVDEQPVSVQPTPFLAFANYEFDDSWLPRASYQLVPWLLDHAGVPLPELYRKLIAIHRAGQDTSAGISLSREETEALYTELLHHDPAQWMDEAAAFTPRRAGN